MRVGRYVTLASAAAVAVVALATAVWLVSPHGKPTPAAVAMSAGQPGPSAPGPSPAAAAERYVVVAEESRALYRVGETLLRFNRPNVAVGVTQAIRGEIFVDRQRLANSRFGVFTVDISQLRSDEPRRDQAIRERWLESARFPIARFQPVSVEGLPETYREGEPVSVILHGELTIRDVVRPVSFEGSFELNGDTLRGTASTTIRMTDFGFDPPSILGVLRANHEVEIEVDVVARRSS
ncbi:MAG: YceI family protein [Bacillota bacterium]